MSKITASAKKTIVRLIQIQRIIRFFSFDSFLHLRKAHTVPKSILVVQIEGIGDYILVRNFLEVLKTAERYRGYSITLCGNESYKDLAMTFDSQTVSDFIWVNHNSFKRHLFYRFALLAKIRRKGFEVVLNPVYSRDSILEDSIVRAAGARESVGCKGDFIHAKHWERKIFNKYYTELIDISQSAVFEFSKIKEYFEKLLDKNISVRKPSLPSLLRQANDMKYAVVCPGALLSKRRWHIENFLHLIDYLHSKYGLTSFLVGDIHDLPAQKEQQSIAERSYVTNMIGKSDLCQTIALIQGSLLVVSNDTSIAHIGAAADIPVVVISNGNHFGRFTEYPKELHPAVFYAYPPEIAGSRFSFEELVEKFKDGSSLNIQTIAVDTVKNLVDKALK